MSFGLGGPEIGVPRPQFAPQFAAARAAGLHSVPHAGESTGPQTIWDALDDLGAERIGHGINAVHDPALMAHLAERDIALEICPTSNVCTRSVPTLADHPLAALVAAGVPVTINSDDPPMFATTLNQEYVVAADLLGLDEAGLADLAHAGVRHSFADAGRKAQVDREIDAYLAGTVTGTDTQPPGLVSETSTAPPDAPTGPTGPSLSADRGSRRITGVDLARGLALIGMAATHMLMVQDQITGHLTGVGWVAAGRASALFAVLAGVSLALVTGGATPKRGADRAWSSVAIAVRAIIIGCIGLWLAGIGSPVAVILAYYALLFVLALPFLGLRTPSLAVLAGCWAVLGPVVSHRWRQGLPEGPNAQVTFTTLLDDPVAAAAGAVPHRLLPRPAVAHVLPGRPGDRAPRPARRPYGRPAGGPRGGPGGRCVGPLGGPALWCCRAVADAAVGRGGRVGLVGPGEQRGPRDHAHRFLELAAGGGAAHRNTARPHRHDGVGDGRPRDSACCSHASPGHAPSAVPWRPQGR